MADTQKIVKKNILDLLTLKGLDIPSYQRPYKWTLNNVIDLLTDISIAIEDNHKYTDGLKYRIGTILLHHEKNQDKEDHDIYHIIDGQQRILTMLLICKCLRIELDECNLINNSFQNPITQKNLHDNYFSIYQWFALKTDEEKSNFINAIRDIIEVVVIVVENEAEAFQLFDSQNSRGKELDPHALLKAYHLRKMSPNNPGEDAICMYEMQHAVEKWENEDPKEIKKLFSSFLFPISNWSKKVKSNEFTDKHIGFYKGSELQKGYTYAMRAFKASPYFQINEPFISGKDFFEYVNHYLTMKKDLEKQVKALDIIHNVLDDKDKRLSLCKTLFYCAIMAYYDKFHNLDTMAIIRLFTWAYMIRVDMKHLNWDTINKYAIGEMNTPYSNRKPIFSIIANARQHTEIANLIIKIYFKSNEGQNGLEKLRMDLCQELKYINMLDDKIQPERWKK